MTPTPAPMRLFLDSGVIVEGCYSVWGASRGVLILAAQRRRDVRVVLAEAVEREVRRALALTIDSLLADQQSRIVGGFEGWLARASIESVALPSEDEIVAHYRHIMPALRHENDVPVVVSAILAKPDWVLSTNLKHWNVELVQRTGLRIASPQQFLEHLRV